MAFKHVDIVEARLWNKLVGTLAYDPGSGYYAFEYEPSWIGSGIEVAPVHMPLSRSVYVFRDLPEKTFYRLPALFADALPDRFGNALINAYLAREGVPTSSVTPLDRLAYMANRAMGALEFKPSRAPRAVKPGAIVMSQLVDGARAALLGNFDSDTNTKAAIANLIKVGTSAGGARAKAVIAWNRKTGDIRSGQLPVAEEGYEYWLMKFDGVGTDLMLGTAANYGRIEYAYHLMAKAAGIDMAECTLLEEGGRAHFMTRRFDREQGNKVHMQTLCAMAHLDYNQIGVHDYNQYFLTIASLGLGVDAYVEAFRRMVFNVVAANNDDHTKNFSFIRRQGKGWELSPAYDVTHAYNPSNQWLAEHLMAVNGKTSNITMEDFARVADQFKVPDYKGIVRHVTTAVARWREFAELAHVPEADIVKIEHDLKAVHPPKR